MRKKLFSVLLIFSLGLLSISCQLFSKEETPEPTPVYVVITNTPAPAKTLPPDSGNGASSDALIPLPFMDDFNSYDFSYDNWPVGSYSGTYADVTYDLKDGVYQWSVTSHDDSTRYAWPDLVPAKEMTIMVDARQSSSNYDSCDYGIIYLQPDETRYLSLVITNNEFSVYEFDDVKGWTAIVDWTDTYVVFSGGVNSLKVTRKDDQFTFYANGERLSRFNYSGVEEGIAGISVDNFEGNVTCNVEFDNFSVTSP